MKQSTLRRHLRSARALLTLSATLLCALPALVPAPARADIADRMGSNSTQSAPSQEVYTAYQASGLRVTRIGFLPREYWNKDTGKVVTTRADAEIPVAIANGLRPVILFNYYARDHATQIPLSQIGSKSIWYNIGRTYASKFGPMGVTQYSAFNEPMGRWNDTDGDGVADWSTTDYKNALEGLADGVHSVSSSYEVSPHGYRQEEIWASSRKATGTPVLKNKYLAAVVPLFNNGKLTVLDIHRYVGRYFPLDTRYEGPSAINPLLVNNPRFSMQTQFDEAKRVYGITRNIKHACSEVNANDEGTSATLGEDEAKSTLLTIFWSSLGVVDNNNAPVNRFTLVFTLLKPDDQRFSISKTLDPWVPAPRGETIKLVTRLASGLEITSSDPRRTGVIKLSGGNRDMWVWHNRQYWSNLWRSDSNSFTVDGIPASATFVEVYDHNGYVTSQRVYGRSSLTFNGLPSNRTLMFVASAPQSFGPRQLINRYSGKSMEIEKFSSSDGVNVRQWTPDGSDDKQIWRFVYQYDGYYLLLNQHSGKALSVDTGGNNGGKDPGANVFQYNTDARDNRLWRIEPVGGGYYRLINKLSGQSLAVDTSSNNNGRDNGANVFQYSYDGTLSNKQWSFKDAPSSSSSALSAPAASGSGSSS